MPKTNVVIIYDVGKTNKKLILFDQQYKVVHEESIQFNEITDEDGFPCEDIHVLTGWIKHSFNRILELPQFQVKAANIAAYGASFVYVDHAGKVNLPLYNYLKPYPSGLLEKFYTIYGGKDEFALSTSSPVLGSLNSGMQLYRIKNEKPESFKAIKFALHLPQYLSWVLSSAFYSDITSIGSHTNLWNFKENRYHEWVRKEGIEEKLAPVIKSADIAGFTNGVPIGVGLHDSSAALIPYQACFAQPFVLLSTGTWSISLNPFNHSSLTVDELNHDCLCYLSFEGKPVKASRLFAGFEHEQQVKKISAFFQKTENYYTALKFDPSLLEKLDAFHDDRNNHSQREVPHSPFASRDLAGFPSFETAYHQLIADIVFAQVKNTSLVMKGTAPNKLFVDGGFSKNPVYMNMLASALPEVNVFAALVPQATATGAAFAIKKQWNDQPLSQDLIDLKQYLPQQNRNHITAKNQ